MTAVPSTMLPLGTKLPRFSLPNVVDGRMVSPADFRDRPALLVMFICNHCPYVQHVRTEIGRIADEYPPRGVGIVAISSNDVAAFPDDAPDKMKAVALAEGWRFPYLFDETQAVAQAFRAACTPEFYLFDRQRKLVYRGQLDGSRPKNDVPVTGRDLRAALDARLSGKPISPEQIPSVGCNIKWKPGNEPQYFAIPAR
ncbi:MAG: thioredoxin family protein [Gemmatimonadetes bacterium]|nr:thioredoxin family protein [Gemmatimonadota bacterium]